MFREIKVFFVTRGIWSWAIFLPYFHQDSRQTSINCNSGLRQPSGLPLRQQKCGPTFGEDLHVLGSKHMATTRTKLHSGKAHFNPNWGCELVLHPVVRWIADAGQGGKDGRLIRAQAWRSQLKMEHCSQPPLFPANNGAEESRHFHWKAKINGRSWCPKEHPRQTNLTCYSQWNIYRTALKNTNKSHCHVIALRSQVCACLVRFLRKTDLRTLSGAGASAARPGTLVNAFVQSRRAFTSGVGGEGDGGAECRGVFVVRADAQTGGKLSVSVN